MELTCALVLTFASLVTATPHGYGMKGGALAKADARAVAGAYSGFGEVPLSIPSGTGFSGSYSKSSSSSFASSSASSSASSFSYSGSGPAVLGSNGISGLEASGSGGCTSGNCPSSGIQDSRGAGSSGTGQTYGGAKAAAAAGAVAGAGSPVYSGNGNQPCTSGDCFNSKPSSCEGSNCDVPSTDKICTSGQCLPASPTTAASTEHDSKNKCTPGNCEQPSSSSTSTTENDIPVFVAMAPKPTSDLNSQSYGKKPTATGALSSVAVDTAQVHDKPSTYLTAPKEGPSCTSPNCDSPLGSVYDKQNLPSSYNVPIHGNYPGLTSQEKSPNLVNAQPSYQVPSGPSGSASCVTENCAPKIPTYSQEASPAYGPTGSTNCKSSNCAGIPSSSPSVVLSSPDKYPSYSGLPTNAPFANAGALAGASAFSGSFGATKYKLPAYTGGFGGPGGILKPNDYNSPSSIPTSTTIVTAQNPATCSSGSCGPSQLPQYGQGKPTAPGVNYNPPSCSSGNCGAQLGQSSPHYDHNSGLTKPTQPTGGFGGPAGILKPNDFNTATNNPVYIQNPSAPGISCTSGTCGPQSSSNTSPHHDLSNSPTGNQYKPTSPTGTYNPVTCSSGNCGTHPSQTYQPPYSQSPSKPAAPAPTNGFGGPPGILKPNDYNFNAPTSIYKPTPVTYNPTSVSLSQNALSSSPTGPPYKPIASPSAGSTISCSSGNCGSSQPLSVYGQTGSHKPLAPAGTYNPVSCSYGNCGSKPSQLGNIPTTSLSSVQYKPTSPTETTGTTSCSAGNCASQTSQSLSQHGPTAPLSEKQYNPASARTYNPSSCPSGNCGSQPSQSTPQYSYNGSVNGAYAAAGAVAGASAVAYNRGFGGPPGLLKPYDDGKLGSSGTTGISNKYAGSELSAHHSTAPGGGIYSSYGKSLNGAGTGPLTGSGASAVAGAAAGTYDGGNNLQGVFNNKAGNYGNDNQIGGCKDGCGINGGNFGPNRGYPEEVGFNTAGAAAKSTANAGAGSFGFGGSFASSSASAHASAGAATKGGYGRR